MTEKDIELILIEGLFQTPETRIDFYFSKAKETNCTSNNFCLALYKAYKRLEKIVNTSDYTTWETDEITGKKKYILNTINLYYFTNGKHLGNLDNDNISELLPPLLEMTKQLKQSEETNKIDIPPFSPKIEGLQEWILTDHINKFTEIETELFKRGYIDNSHKWQKKKTELAEFICVLINYKYFKPIVNGKKIQDFHKKQFISERYGYKKTGLSETWKKAKPKIESAKISFFWINKPE